MGDQAAIQSLSDKSRYGTSDGCPREQGDERMMALNALSQMDPAQALVSLKKVLARREPCTQRLDVLRVRGLGERAAARHHRFGLRGRLGFRRGSAAGDCGKHEGDSHDGIA